MVAVVALVVSLVDSLLTRENLWVNSVPVGGFFGIFFILPICFTLPPLADILEAPNAQALPYIFHRVMGSPGGGLGLIFLVLAITLFCSISITNAASRCTWAISRDDAVPGAALWARVSPRFGVPTWALFLLTVVQMLLGLINLGSTSAFTAFVSVGVIALALSYAIPIGISLAHGRREVARARFHCGRVVGTVVNVVALAWIAFELVLFSMPTALPVDEVTMNYASVVLVGFMAIAGVWYAVHSRKCEYDGGGGGDGGPCPCFVSAVEDDADLSSTDYKGPPASDGLVF